LNYVNNNAERAAARPDLKVSFEFFPPKNEQMERTLWQTIERLAPFRPRWVSVTYGAGGSTRDRSTDMLARLLRETDLRPAAHLTCVRATRAQVDEVIRTWMQIGVRHIVALRGDPPEGVGEVYTPHPGGYESSVELVRGIKQIGPFEVSVSAYPEKHPESPSVEADLNTLAAKVDAGADRAITQFFFDNADFFRYLDRARARGIDIPITAGIMPMDNFQQVARFAGSCGARIPDWLARRFDGLEDDPETARLVAAGVAVEQITELLEAGVSEFHIYTLNRAGLTEAICHSIGLKPDRESQAGQHALPQQISEATA
jgi:methylenetetrahydrofolate reductase (NADPH)